MPDTAASASRLRREQANQETITRMFAAEPILKAVAPLREVSEIDPNVILTSGPPSATSEYRGGQRRAICYGAMYEGLAETEQQAAEMLECGEIVVASCQEYSCVGSLAGIYTPSMPVFVVENQTDGNRAYCNLYEGESPRRLNYGVYDEQVERSLRFLERVLAPTIGAAVEAAGGIPLKPLMRRALNMGDELHSRNTAASLLFSRELFPYLKDLACSAPEGIDQTLEFLRRNDYFFLRLSMAAAKVIADAGHGVDGSSIVSGMCLSGHNFGIRVSGLGDEWITGPLPTVEAKLFEGFTEEDIEWMGGESCMTECVGLGGFAQAAAPALQEYQGGTPAAMAQINRDMYEITVAENPDFKIPYLGYRGTPTGIDVLAVIDRDMLPVIDAGVAGRDGGQIGAGTVRPPMRCFEEAAARFATGK